MRVARKIGLKGIAITDHNTIDGVDKALELSTSDFLIIPGIEVSSKDGHILGLGIKNKIQRGLSALETVENIRDEGGIAIAAHPFSLSLKPFSILKADFNAIEVFNPRRYLANHIAKRYSLKYDIPKFAGSDAHLFNEIGRAGIEVHGDPSVEELLDRIRRGEVSIFGRILPLRDYLRRALYKCTAL